MTTIQESISTAEIMLAGIGGQGILVAGRLIGHTATAAGKHALYTSEYEGIVRGGNVQCTIFVSPEEIGSPLPENPSHLIAMHQRVIDTHLEKVRVGGFVLVNSTLASVPQGSRDLRFVSIPASQLAEEMGGSNRYVTLATMVALGAFIEATNILPLDQVIECLKFAIPAHRQQFSAKSREALNLGAQYVRGKTLV